MRRRLMNRVMDTGLQGNLKERFMCLSVYEATVRLETSIDFKKYGSNFVSNISVIQINSFLDYSLLISH